MDSREFIDNVLAYEDIVSFKYGFVLILTILLVIGLATIFGKSLISWIAFASINSFLQVRCNIIDVFSVGYNP